MYLNFASQFEHPTVWLLVWTCCLVCKKAVNIQHVTGSWNCISATWSKHQCVSGIFLSCCKTVWCMCMVHKSCADAPLKTVELFSCHSSKLYIKWYMLFSHMLQLICHYVDEAGNWMPCMRIKLAHFLTSVYIGLMCLHQIWAPKIPIPCPLWHFLSDLSLLIPRK